MQHFFIFCTINPNDLIHPSPAMHFKTSQVFLIYFPKCSSFSVIQGQCNCSHITYVTTILTVSIYTQAAETAASFLFSNKTIYRLQLPPSQLGCDVLVCVCDFCYTVRSVSRCALIKVLEVMPTSVYTGLNPFNFIRKHFLQICL
jgi:hypothetical protein